MTEHKPGDRAEVKMTTGSRSWWMKATLSSIHKNGLGKFTLDDDAGFSYRKLISDDVRYI